MKEKQEFIYYTSMLRSGKGSTAILLQAEPGNVTISTRKIVAEIPVVHDHRGITPKNWRKQLYKLANLPQAKL